MRLFLAVVATAGMLAFGCSGGSNDNGADPSSTAAATETAAATATERPPASPTPRPTPTPDVSACPLDAVTCGAAQRFVDAWRAKDANALLAMARPLQARCPVPRPIGLGGPYPLCDDATVDGEVREGYVWSSGTHGGLDTLERVADGIRGLLDSDKPMLTIGCDWSAEFKSCAGDFSLIFGPDTFNGVPRGVTELAVLRDGAEDPGGLVGVLPVIVSECPPATRDDRCALMNGGTYSARGYRYWGDEAEQPAPLPLWTFFRWSP